MIGGDGDGVDQASEPFVATYGAGVVVDSVQEDVPLGGGGGRKRREEGEEGGEGEEKGVRGGG